jgi:hypothetical protein
MTAKEVIKAMSKGAVLCKEYAPAGPVDWLEPKRIVIRSDVAATVIKLPGIVSGDGLFRGEAGQTWASGGRAVWR